MTTTTAQPDALSKIIKDNGLTTEKAGAIIAALAPLVEQAGTLCEQAKTIAVTDATQVSEMREARELRLKLVKVRTAAERERVALKADALATGKAVDACARWVKDKVEPVEAKLEEAEKFAERAEAKRKADLVAERAPKLREYGVDPSMYPLGEMKPAEWDRTLEGARLAFEAERERARKAEADRLAQVEAERVGRERIKAENDRLREEAQKREAAMAEERRKAKAEADAAAEKARKEREALEETARQERLRLQGIADTERQKREAAEKETADRLAAEKKQRDAEARKARKAAAAPDATKLRAWAKSLRTSPMPHMATPEGTAALRAIVERAEHLWLFIEDQAEQIGGA